MNHNINGQKIMLHPVLEESLGRGLQLLERDMTIDMLDYESLSVWKKFCTLQNGIQFLN